MCAACSTRRSRSFASRFAVGFCLAASTLGASGCRLAGLPTRESRATAASRDFGNRGMQAMEQEQWDAAEDLLAKAVAACPNDPDARMRYADALRASGRAEQAISELAEAIRLSPQDATPLVRMSQLQLELGQAALAGRAANLAIDLDPESAAAWRARGRAYAAAGEDRRALEDFQRGLSFGKDDRETLLDLAQTYRRLEQPQRMLAVIERLKDAYPPGETPQEVLYLEGLAHQSRDRHERAAQCFEAALACGPKRPEIAQALAASSAASRPSGSRQAERGDRRGSTR